MAGLPHKTQTRPSVIFVINVKFSLSFHTKFPRATRENNHRQLPVNAGPIN